MVAEAFDIVDEFLADIRLEFRRQLIHGTGKHEILPDNQSHLVANIIEPVLRVIAAAPHTDGVVIRRHALRKEFPGGFRRNPPEQMVFRNIIRAHGKDGDAVYLMGKALPPRILFNPHCHCPKSYPPLPDIGSLSVCIEHYLHGIKWLSAVAVGPPELGMFN